jgi:hypothetical protein
MVSRRRTLATVLTCAALAAGCGSSSDKNPSSATFGTMLSATAIGQVADSVQAVRAYCGRQVPRARAVAAARTLEGVARDEGLARDFAWGGSSQLQSMRSVLRYAGQRLRGCGEPAVGATLLRQAD